MTYRYIRFDKYDVSHGGILQNIYMTYIKGDIEIDTLELHSTNPSFRNKNADECGLRAAWEKCYAVN